MVMYHITYHGPVTMSFQVHDSFMGYQYGVYTVPYGSYTENWHAVKVIGWGTEQDWYGNWFDYWLCVNSWGTNWGDNGTFKIRRGTNEARSEEKFFGLSYENCGYVNHFGRCDQ